MAKAGWYTDPLGNSGLLRYWDGSRWTEHSRPLADLTSPDGQLPTTDSPPSAYVALPDSQLPPAGVAPPTGSSPAGEQLDRAWQRPPERAARVYPQSGYPDAGQPVPPAQPLPLKDNSGYALASLGLGLGGFLLICIVLIFGYACGVTGLIFAVRGWSSNRRGVAIAGLVINIILLLITVFLHALFTLDIMGIIDLPGFDPTLPPGWGQ